MKIDKFVIEDVNKDFAKEIPILSKEITMNVDYDDVNHEEVEAAMLTVVEILNKYWDQNLFREKLKNIRKNNT